MTGGRGWAWAGLATVALAYAPMVARPGIGAPEDWDWFAAHYEAARVAVLHYGEFPWWNPWNCGGMPLAENPQVGIVSPTFLAVLACGAWPGLRWSALLHAALGYLGMRRLLADQGPAAATAGGIVFALAGGPLAAVFAGHLGIFALAWFPWCWLALRALPTRPAAGAALGALAAGMVLEGLHYVAAFQLAALGIAALAGCCRGPAEAQRRVRAGSALAALAFVALAGGRLWSAWEFAADFPRDRAAVYHVALTAEQAARSWLHPRPDPQREVLEVPPRVLLWHEFGSYLGAPALLLAAWSLRGGVRWQHLWAAGAMVLALGNTEPWLPGSWVQELPGANLLRVPTRWRLLAPFGLAWAVAWSVARLDRRWPRAAALAVGVVATDLTAHALWLWSFLPPPRADVPRHDAPPVQRERMPPNPPAQGSCLYEELRRGFGVVHGYEPLLAPLEAPRAVRGCDHPEYRGEGHGPPPFERTAWSPSRQAFRGPPGAPAFVNQNPGRGWRLDGQPLFPAARAVSKQQLFAFGMPPAGTAEIAYRPARWEAKLALQAAAAALALAWAWRLREWPTPAVQP